jgi:magnesium transporter
MTFQKSNPPIGARPGTLAIPKGSPPPRITITAYTESDYRTQEIEDASALGELVEEQGVTWVNVQGLGDEDVLRQIQQAFDLHPIVLENAVNTPQRAKSEVIGGHHLMIVRVPVADGNGRIMTPPQVCIVFSDRTVITFQERPFGFFDAVRERISRGGGPMRSLGAGYLAYALLDTLVDHYFPLAEELSARVEDLEEDVNQEPGPELLARIHELRRDLVVLRRVGWPQREAISSALRDNSPFVTDHVRTYLRDTHDHMTQIMELTDATRDASASLTEIYLSQVGFRTNEIMKVLTLMASIFIPLTFIAGIYGMNFEYMPELHDPRGYFVALSLMFILALGMIFYFRHRGWLGRRGGRDTRSRRDEVG